MSIVAMDRLRLAAMAADREALLRALQHAGCVELTAAEPTEADGLSAFARPDGAALAAAQERLHTCRAALECLDRYAPEKKKGLFRKRPVITEQQLFDPESAKRTEAAAKDLLARQQELAALDAERTKLEALRASLAPWRSVDLPLNGGGGGALLAWLGTLPASVSEEERQNAAAALDGLAEWTEASCDRQLRYLVFVCHASVRDRAAETLRAMGFSRVSFRGLDGTAEENDARAAQRLAEAEEEKKAAEQAIAAHAADREALLLALDRAGVDLRREQAKQELVQTQSLLYLEGWLPCKRRAALEAALEISERLKTTTAKKLGFAEGAPYNHSIPLLTRTESGFQWSTLQLSAERRKADYPRGTIDEFTLARLKKVKKTGHTWSVRIFLSPEPVAYSETEDDGRMEAPIFPFMLMAADETDQRVLDVNVCMGQNSADFNSCFTNGFVKQILNEGKPSTLLVEGRRAITFFDDLCDQMDIQIEVSDEGDTLNDAVDHFLTQMDGGMDPGMDTDAELAQLEMLLQDPAACKNIPDIFIDQMKTLADMGKFPEHIEDLINAEWNRRGLS